MTTHPPRLETVNAYQWDLRVKVYEEASNLYHPEYDTTELNHTLPGYNRREEYLRDESEVPGAHEKYCSHYVRGSRVFHDAFRRYRLRGSPPGLFYSVVETGPNLQWYWPSEVLGPIHEPFGGTASRKLVNLFDQETGFRSVADPVDLDELRQRGLTAMLPDIKPDLSLINAILELRDFKTLPKTMLDMRRLIDRLHGKWGRSTRRNTFRRWVRGVSDAHLQYAFGIGPFLSDVTGLFKALQESKRQLKELVARRGIPQRHHYRLPLGSDYKDRIDTADYVPTWGAPTWHAQGEWSQQRSVSYKDASFHMTLDYSYDIVGAERELSEIDVLLDRMGVNLNPAILWNAIPWTFIVDWVFNVSKWLNQFAVRNVNLRTVIHDCSWSITVDREIRCDLIIADGDTGFSARTVGSVIRETAYKRVPWSPDIVSSVRQSGVSLREASLLYSLIAVRIRR